MHLSYWSVLVAALLPIVCAGISKSGTFGRPPADGGYDNAHPREWLATLSGWRARANAAQANGFEALPFFSGAVLIAQQSGTEQARIDTWAMVFIACRLVYIACYLGNWANARSLAWVGGLAACVALLPW